VIAEPVASSSVVVVDRSVGDDANVSGISWSAVVGGALVAAALALILLALGAGFGLAMASPWTAGGSSTALGAIGIVWIIVMQVIASSLGGYLAGRLRSKWTRVHTDEVYFRDTAHGFLAWALAAVLTVTLLASAAASAIGAATRTATTPAGAGAPTALTTLAPGGYYVDRLFRGARAQEPADALVRAEAEGGRLVTHLLETREDSGPDVAALSALVATYTGLSANDANARVAEVMAAVRQSADDARRTAEHASFWTFMALLIGAFCASWAATVGGRQRDGVLPAAPAHAR
jgi:hypothetical protein